MMWRRLALFGPRFAPPVIAMGGTHAQSRKAEAQRFASPFTPDHVLPSRRKQAQG